MTSHRSLICGSAASIFAFNNPILRGRPVADRPDDLGTAIKSFSDAADKVKGFADKTNEHMREYGARLTAIEQKAEMRGGGAPLERKSIGQRFVDSEAFKTLKASASQNGKIRVEIETKDITSAVGSAGGAVVPDYRPEIIQLPQRRMVVRDLLAPGQTSSNTVYFVQQATRTLNAAPVSEDPSAPKPQSDTTFVNREAPVRTIAHFMKASRQVLDDAPALSSTIDSDLRYGLADEEERQLLSGDGTGNNLLGLIPQATAFAMPSGFTTQNATIADTLLFALAQAEMSLLPATGIVLNTQDWYRLLALKDSQNRYLSTGPFGPLQQRVLWNMPIVPTMAMTQGTFLCGSFGIGAQIYDRLLSEVLLSTEDADNFQKNMITIRGEERLALAVKRPAAFITGSLTPPSS